MDFGGKTVAEFTRELAGIAFFSHLKPHDLMKTVPLFVGLPDKELGDLAEKARLIQVEPGEIVCREGEYESQIHIILSGTAEATARTQSKSKVLLDTYGPGMFFGGTSIRPDAASACTVTATERMVLLSLHMNDLALLSEKSGELAKVLASTHQRRTIGYGLRLVPFFSTFSQSDLDDLGKRGKLRAYERGEVIFHQGDEGESLHLVLSGIVKVVIQTGEEDRILAYLKRGACFGEMALVKNETRMASVVAVNPTETLQILKDDFNKFLLAHPETAREINSTIAEREAENLELEKNPEGAARLKFMEGLIDSTEVLVIDLNRCIRCDNCVEACAAVRGNARIRREGEHFGSYVVATACRQCGDPACMLCPRGAISRDRRGEIHFGENCVGCGFCAKQCPYGNITIIEIAPDSERGKKRRKAVKCDLCRDRDYAPCVYNCPTGALQRVSPEEFFVKVAVKK